MNPNKPEQPNDSLDALLRQWHNENAQRAAAQRDQLMRAVSSTLEAHRAQHDNPFKLANVRRLIMNRYMPIAASLALIATLLVLFVPMSAQPAFADGGTVMVPEGGKLEALDGDGNLIGPCALKHTHVDVNVSGFLSRVTLTQEYHNPYDSKIEAVYTFPMSHRGAVDGFKMTVGDRVVVGEVKERQAARQIYEQARESGYVASLLEQERPNIFTQSVANIEPNATVEIEISYIEIVEEKDGEYEFSFPMVVGPRYIPGRPTVSHSMLPAELTARRGVVLQGPAQLTIGAAGEASTLGTLQPGKLNALLESAESINYPGETWWGTGDETGGATQPKLWHRFEATYGDGSKEFGELYADGTGWINGRWFYFDPKLVKEMGTGFAQDTNQVPDASRITPMPVKPGTRAGHDISLDMTIDTGGPGIVALKSAMHKIIGGDIDNRAGEPPSTLHISLANAKEIPNRDFVLSWKQESENIEEATFTHTGTYGDYQGGFFTLILEPPARVPDWPIRPRELVFVMDTSGSMSGFPIEKSKEVITKAIASMRPQDTFNVITFAGSTSILWPEPRPATDANRQAAQDFVNSRSGGGGTEMMKAIETALVQEAPALRAERSAMTLEQLANLPADGREAVVELDWAQWNTIAQEEGNAEIKVRDDLAVRVQRESNEVDGFIGCPVGESQIASGIWSTVNGQRVFIVKRCAWKNGRDLDPMRIVLFLTDGYVGNEAQIIEHVRNNAQTTRVFSFGIGNSVNRMLLDGMAEAGRGEVEYVLLNANGDEAVERFTRRIETPVLTDITLAFSDGLKVTDLLPKGGMVPDLFDAKPLVIQGRYNNDATHTGTLTIKGQTGGGPYERTLNLTFPKNQPEHRATATLWARGMVDEFTKTSDTNNIIALGEAFQIMTAHTSFVAVEKSRVTIEGKPVLVAIPVELPDGTRFEGFFGGEVNVNRNDEVVMLGTQFSAASDADDQQNGDKILAARQKVINEDLMRIRQLQLEMKYDEALQVVDEVLFLDEQNPAALFMRDVLQSSEKDRDFARMQRIKEISYAKLHLDAPELIVESSPNMGAPGPQSTTGLMAYPEDWPEESAGYQVALQELSKNISPSELRVLLAEPGSGMTLQPPPDGMVDGADLKVLLGNWGDDASRMRGELSLLAGESRDTAGSELAQGDATSTRSTDMFFAKSAERKEVDAKREPLPSMSRQISPDPSQSGGGRISGGGGSGGRGGTIFDEPAAASAPAPNPQPTAAPAEAVAQAPPPPALAGRQVAPTERPAAERDRERTAAAGDESLREKLPSSKKDDARENEAKPANEAVAVGGVVDRTEELHDASIEPADANQQIRDKQVDEAQAKKAARQDTLTKYAERIAVALDAPQSPQLFNERTILFIALLHDEDMLESAQMLAKKLAEARQDFELGVAMNDALHDDAITADARSAKVKAIADKAETVIRETYEALQRALRIRSVVDQRLLPIAFAKDAAAAELPEGVQRIDGGLLLSVLLKSYDSDVQKQLKALNIKVLSSSNAGPFVVAAVPADQIAELAVEPFVRKIEPARTSAE